jgi:exportin-2 (importin alpha re-exporter)
VTAVNELIPIGDFLRAHVMPELQRVEGEPMVKAACIKYISTFRNQLGREDLTALLGVLVQFAGSASYVVHTYAASAIERILTVKDKVADAATGRTVAQPRLPPDAVTPVVLPVVTTLLTRMSAAGYPENDYLMKCLMRVVQAVKANVVPYTGDVIAGLTTVLGRVCANPANPTFNHFLFETIAVLMRNVCTAQPQSVGDFEAMVFPPFTVRGVAAV